MASQIDLGHSHRLHEDSSSLDVTCIDTDTNGELGTVIESIQPMSGVSKYYWASVADFVGIGEAD